MRPPSRHFRHRSNRPDSLPWQYPHNRHHARQQSQHPAPPRASLHHFPEPTPLVIPGITAGTSLARISMRLEACARRLQQMLAEHALWMAHHRAKQRARHEQWLRYHRAQQLEYQRIRQMAYLRHPWLVRHQHRQQEHKNARYWALRRRVMQQQGGPRQRR
ncbi:hypothetical protein U9M48_044253 [Paspalum notatum var. saurae]|uniref:Uncharacterized protein n=1 Tax=Paspalum notatum var. saurae TaxID=547442 RepID=A0AAQ3XHB0_PASNO